MKSGDHIVSVHTPRALGGLRWRRLLILLLPTPWRGRVGERGAERLHLNDRQGLPSSPLPLKNPGPHFQVERPKAIRVAALTLFMAQASALPVATAEGDLYDTLCAACHGHGQAPIGPYPPLFGSAILATAGPYYIAIKAMQGAGNMFPLCGMATDEEVARLANELARANGNAQPAITPEEVAVLRPAADECPDVEY